MWRQGVLWNAEKYMQNTHNETKYVIMQHKKTNLGFVYVLFTLFMFGNDDSLHIF